MTRIVLGKAPASSALARLGETTTVPVTVDVRTPKEIADEKFKWKVYGVLGTISMAVSAYHGYKRNGGSLGWAAWWAVLGATFPVITPAVAFVEGFAEPTFKTTRIRDELSCCAARKGLGSNLQGECARRTTPAQRLVPVIAFPLEPTSKSKETNLKNTKKKKSAAASGSERRIPAVPSVPRFLTKTEIVEGFNRWMAEYIDKPEAFEESLATVLRFMREAKAGAELSYGEQCFGLLSVFAQSPNAKAKTGNGSGDVLFSAQAPVTTEDALACARALGDGFEASMRQLEIIKKQLAREKAKAKAKARVNINTGLHPALRVPGSEQEAKLTKDEAMDLARDFEVALGEARKQLQRAKKQLAREKVRRVAAEQNQGL